MKILELVHGREFLDIETVGKYSVRFSLEQMLTLVCCNVGHGSKDVASVSSSALNAVTVVDTAISSLRIHIKILQVIIEINRASAKVSPEECGMGSKDSGDIDAALFAQWQSYTRQPFVDVSNNCLFLFMGDKLKSVRVGLSRTKTGYAYLSQKPCNQISEHDGFIGLSISRRRRNGCSIP